MGGGTLQAHPLQASCRKLQEGWRPDQSLCTRRETRSHWFLLQEALSQRKQFTLDYCTDLKEIHKAHQDLSKNTSVFFEYLLILESSCSINIYDPTGVNLYSLAQLYFLYWVVKIKPSSVYFSCPCPILVIIFDFLSQRSNRERKFSSSFLTYLTPGQVSLLED